MAVKAVEKVVQLPGGALRPFQAEALDFMKAHPFVLIADDVGLGKTVEALAWVHHGFTEKGWQRVLVVCPASIKLQWARETKKWLNLSPSQVQVISRLRGEPINQDAQVAIINYDILKARFQHISAWGPDLVIFDEVHVIKEGRRQRSKAAKQVAQLPSAKSVVGLTGTPIMNRPKELWHPAHVINPEIWPNFFRFAFRYCNPHQIPTTAIRSSDGSVMKSYGQVQWNTAWDFSGASNLEELNQILRQHLMVRRTREEVFDQMPKLQRVTIPFDCDLKAYNTLSRQVRLRLISVRDALRRQRADIESLPPREQERARAERAEGNSTVKLYGTAIQEITLLKKGAAMAKLGPALEWLAEFLETEERLIVFVHHHDVGDAYLNKLTSKKGGIVLHRVLDGRMSQKARQENVDSFVEDGKSSLLFCGLTAMGQGVDGLQYAACNLAFLELGWNPAIHEQAEGRLYRQGQTKHVTAYYLIAADTIEEEISKLVDAKGTVTSAAIGEWDDPGIIESLMDTIIERR